MRMKLIFTLIFTMMAVGVFAQSDTMSLVDLGKASAQIRAKEKELTQKEQDLNARQDRLDAMEADLNSREGELQKIRDEISALIKQYSTESNTELDSLAKMYGSTKPKAAAGVLVKMEVEKTAQLLRRMSSMNASRVMTEIASQDPNYASILTTYMVGDNASNTILGITSGMP